LYYYNITFFYYAYYYYIFFKYLIYIVKKKKKKKKKKQFQIEQLFKYWKAKLIEEIHSIVLPWPDQYPSVLNKNFTREIRSHSISWFAHVYITIIIFL